MPHTAIEQLPLTEMTRRHASVRAHLRTLQPEAAGLMVFSRLNIYYLTGCLTAGVFYLPADDTQPAVLCMRKGIDRARLESPLQTLLPFRSYGDILPRLADAGVAPAAGTPVAAEMGGLPWSLATLLQKKLPSLAFLPGDMALTLTRAVKSDWELAKLREAGTRHHRCLHDLLPERVRPGMSEYEISVACWELFFEHGHAGQLRMQTPGEGIYLGHVAAGDSANYPSVFNGPVGLKGVHPASPFMGHPGTIWEPGFPLTCDVGFSLEGYQTDKTQVLFAGSEADVPDAARRGHEFCVQIQAMAAERMKPGAIPSEIWAEVVARVTAEGHETYFMGHGDNQVSFLGHGIGLAIDEYPVIAKGFDAPLEKGMVLALEPKYGLPGFGMVGVENTFEVTEQGGVCITGEAYDIRFVSIDA